MKIRFSERLKELRTDRDLPQIVIAEVLDCSQRKISWLESGKIEPSLSDLWRLSVFFEVSCDYLIGKTDY